LAAKKLALLGGTKLGSVAPDQHPTFTKRALQRATRLLEKGATVGLGKHHAIIREAEEAISAWQGVRNCMVVSSGHASLQVALLGMDVGPGDEVVTTPYSWGASTSCILHCGAVPIFTDVFPDTGLMDPANLEASITSKTKAILVVHIHGQPNDMPAIMRVARRHRIPVIEDGSQAHGAVVGGKMVGQYGDASGFSCMGFKLLGTTEAGYMLAKRDDVYWRAALFCQHMGRSPDPGFPQKYTPYVDSLVYSYRLSPVTAVLMTEQLKKIDREIAGRRKNVAMLQKAMAGLETVSFPALPRGAQSSYYTLSMNFSPETAGVHRDTFEKALVAEGLPIGHYVPSPIAHWERLRTRGYQGPPTPWTAQLKRAGVNYRSQKFPGCEFKVERSLDMDWNYIKVSDAKMKRMAAIIAKVEENLPALRDWERRQKRKKPRKQKAKPTRREVGV
jgi:dTDP-4-amino-4,6-dideoxygalactose transaminase